MVHGMRLDDRSFQAALRDLSERDVRIASTWALNDTAADVLTHVQDRMAVVFDRPTRFTKNAFMVQKARPSTLEAVVQERPSVGERHYLKVQERGGGRGQTGFEALLSRSLAHEGVIQAIIPADNARLDAFGNWSAGERNQVLSALQAQRDGTANTSAASRKRKSKRATYFVPKTGLTRDIYKREADGQIGIVAHISSKVPTYQRRLGFFEGAGQVYDAKLSGHLMRTLEKMAAKRLGG